MPLYIYFFLVGFQAKELLLLPLDMICGKKEKTMYFWREVNHIDLDFSQNERLAYGILFIPKRE